MIEPAERLRLAFRWIERERNAANAGPVTKIIDRAAERFHLTDAQVIWTRWSLQPQTVAVQSKEPVQ